MRLGSTSYVYPADILTNVRKLAGMVEDVELLMFEVQYPDRDLPTMAEMAELRRIAEDHAMTYTVHLPLDLTLAHGDWKVSVEKATLVMDRTLQIDPYGFIVHLQDGYRGTIHDPVAWVEHSVASLEALAWVTGDTTRICVENLEIHPPDLLDALFAALNVSCCADVGHLWVAETSDAVKVNSCASDHGICENDPASTRGRLAQEGVPPLHPCGAQDGLKAEDLLRKWLPRTRVVHLHGVAHRDHLSLELMPSEKLDPITELLLDFIGVVTMEVFNESDFLSSLRAFEASRRRLAKPCCKHPKRLVPA